MYNGPECRSNGAQLVRMRLMDQVQDSGRTGPTVRTPFGSGHPDLLLRLRPAIGLTDGYSSSEKSMSSRRFCGR